MSKKRLNVQYLNISLSKSKLLIESYRQEMSCLEYKLRCCRLRNVGVRIMDLTTEKLQKMVDNTFLKIQQYYNHVKEFQKAINANLNMNCPTSSINVAKLEIAKLETAKLETANKLLKNIKEFNQNLKHKLTEGKGLNKHMTKLAGDYFYF